MVIWSWDTRVEFINSSEKKHKASMIRHLSWDWRFSKNHFPKLFVIAAVLFLSALLGRKPSLDWIVVLGSGLVGMVTLTVLMQRPVWGIFALIPISLFGRWQIQTGTNVPMNLTFVLLGLLLVLWIGRMFLIERQVYLFPSRTTVPALLFVVASSVSLLAGNIDWVSYPVERASIFAQFGGWSLNVLSVGAFLLVANQLKNVTQLRTLAWLFLTLGGAYIASRMFLFLDPVEKGLFINTKHIGSVFWIWLVALAFGQLVYNDELEPKKRLLFASLVVATFYVSLGQSRNWHSGWIPPLVALGVMTWLHSTRWKLLLLAGLAVVGIFQFSAIYEEIIIWTQHYTVTSRLATYPILFDLIKASPMLGLGPGNYPYYTVFYPIMGWYVRFNSHSNYVDLLAQTGIVGLVLFGWLMWEVTRLAWRLKSGVQDGFNRGYVYAALGGIVGTLFSGFLGDWFLPFIYNISTSGFRTSVFFWVFLGGLVVIKKELSQELELSENGHQP